MSISIIKTYSLLYCVVFSLCFTRAQQNDNLLPVERACLFHIVKKSPALNLNFGSFFEYSGPTILLSDGKVNYDSIEQIIINRPDLLFIRKSEISKGPPGLLAELANKMAVLELNRILLDRRNSFIQNKSFTNPRYEIFESHFIKVLPPAAIVANDSVKKLNKDLYLFTDPALTFERKVEYLNSFKSVTDEDKRAILDAFSYAVNKYLEERCYDIYRSLGGIASAFQSQLIAAGEGGNTAGLLSEFEKNIAGKWNKGLPRAIGLFPYQIQRYNTKKIEPERIASIPMETSGHYRLTNLHFDIWGYNYQNQTTIVIEKGDKSYVLFGAGDTKFLSPDSSFSEGGTILTVINELEKNDIGKLKERISGKKGIEEKFKAKIEKRAQVYQKIQQEESKYMDFNNGKIKVKKRASRKVRKARKRALDHLSEQPNQHYQPTIKSKKKKRSKKQNDLLGLYRQYEELTKDIQYYEKLRYDENEKLGRYNERLDFYRSAVGTSILSYTISDSIYYFSDSSTFDLRTQEFQFYPTQSPETFRVKLISIPQNALASQADEVMMHVTKIEQDPRLTATLNLNLSDQFDSDQFQLKKPLFSPADSTVLKTISELILKNKFSIVFKANGYGIGLWDGNQVVKNSEPVELNGYPTSRADSTFSRLRKTALYVQTKHKLFFEVESFTDPVKSGIMISDKTLVEYAKKNNLSNNDILSGLRTKEVLIQFQDEFIKWVGQNYDAQSARFIIDRFNTEFQKVRITVGKVQFKLKELKIA